MTAKHVSNSPVTFVTRERFAVLWRKLTNYKGLALKMSAVELLGCVHTILDRFSCPHKKLSRIVWTATSWGRQWMSIIHVIKVMWHETIGNDDFQHNTALQQWHCFEWLQHCIAVLCWKSSLRIVPCNITFRDLKIRRPDGNENVKKRYV